MLQEFKEWVEEIIGTAYQFAAGQWEDVPVIDKPRICMVKSNGESPVDVDDRRARFSVTILGPRNDRGNQSLYSDAEKLVDAAITGVLVPCGAASVRSMAGIMGPGYTTENRTFYSLSFEVIF